MRSSWKGIGLVILAISVLLMGANPSLASSGAAKIAKGNIHFGSIVVPFIENKGQVNKEVSLYAKTAGGTVFVTKNGEIVYSLLRHQKSGNQRVVFKEEVIGATPQVKGKVASQTRVNIFKGKDPAKWLRGLNTYNVVTLGEVSKGVTLDLKAYNKKVEKIFTFAPKASVSSLKIALKGAKKLWVDNSGRLAVKTDAGTFYFTKPVAYQPLGKGGRVFVEAKYKVQGNTYSFEVSRYDATKPLVIDPLLASTFLGGSNFDEGWDIALAPNGEDVYVVGETSSTDFPATSGSYNSTYGGGESDAYVAVFNNDLSELKNCTYLGGNGTDVGYGIAVNGTGVYIVGKTNSTNFPTTAGANDTSYNGGDSDAFIAIFDLTLSNLQHSTYLGGNGTDEGYDIALGSVYITGTTNSSDFPGGGPTTGGYGVFVSKFSDDLSSRDATTVWDPTSYEDKGMGIVTDGSHVFVTGYENFGSGDANAFVSRWDTNLTSQDHQYFGALNSDDFGTDITQDNNNVYITGRSGNNILIAKASKTDLSNNNQVTIGGNNVDYGWGISISGSDLYITGYTNSTENLANGGLYDDTYNGGDADAFVMKIGTDLDTNSAKITYLGGSQKDEGTSVAVGNSGVYVTGYTYSGTGDFPTTAGAWCDTYASNGDAFVALLDDNLTGYQLTVNALGPAGSGNASMYDLNTASHSLSGSIQSVAAVGNWSDTYSKDTQVPLNATVNDEKYKFVSWNCSDTTSTTNPNITVTTNATMTCNATFALKQADLGITKNVSNSTAYVGDTITYTITITNNGPDCATGVVMTDTLPSGLTVVGCSTTQGNCSLSGTTFTCNVGTINNGTTSNTATITITANVTCPFTGTNNTLNNTATVTSTSNDTDTSNNTANNSTDIIANLTVGIGGDCSTCYDAVNVISTENSRDGSPINCTSSDGNCSKDFNAGTSVNLSYSGIPSMCYFAGWNCTHCNGTSVIDTNPSHTVTMDGNVTCNATFNLLSPTLTVEVSGAGSVVSNPAGINCGSTCSAQFPPTSVTTPATVTLTATAGDNYYFDHWEGDCSGSTTLATVTMDSDKTCTAVFSKIKIPDPPNNFKAQITPCAGGGGNAKVVLTWSKVDDAMGYIIYDSLGHQLAWLRSPYTTSTTLYNLRCGKIYHLCIRTWGRTQNSDCSPSITVEIPPCDQCQEEADNNTPTPVSVDVIWPTDNSNIKYNDFSAGNGLVVFAWKTVEGAAAYKLYIALDDGSGPQGGEYTPEKGNGPGELIVVPEANLAGVYFIMSRDVWNALSKYKVIWKVTALDSSGKPLGDTGEVSFGFEPWP